MVTGVDGENRAVALDQTAFYPGGGGQPPDFGSLISRDTNYVVKRSRKIGDDIYHYLEGDLPLPAIGDQVYAAIDWDHRYKLMRTHTAMHILCGVIFRDYGASVTGGEMDLLKGRMDFEFETLRAEFVHEIEESINREIQKDLEVNIDILPRE